MKKKINFFDKLVLKQFASGMTTMMTIFSLIVIFFPISKNNIIWASLFLMILLISYIVFWIRANCKGKTTLIINNSKLIVKIGDIFKEKSLKVIAFNEYFDTKVDNKIISENSLNGKYLKEINTKISNIDDLILSDERLKERIVETNTNRKSGKQKKYKLGSIVKDSEYILLAFAHFDEQNRAFLETNDYVSCLLSFWNELDIVYAGQTVSIPLLGSGITRFKDNIKISEQELLEILIQTFRISRVKFEYPSRVNIIIYPGMKDKINFHKLKEYSD